MRLSKTAFILAIFLSWTQVFGADFLEKEVVFSEADIQAAIAKSGPVQKNYGGLISVALKETPQITLNSPDGRARIAAYMDIMLLGNPPVAVHMTGRAGIRYDDKAKAFFLENTVADSVESVALPKEMEATARQAVSQLIAGYFRAKPVYVLRQDGSPQEIAARWLLKSVRIEPGKVIATLSPL